ncbi:MAG: hypothetical protein JWM47_2160 [Acidimicrobiales bacterium]|nr:hypothetical protein [Acidimicrobiales bacterium]
MASVIDDHLLLDVLIGDADPWLTDEIESTAIYTTGSWSSGPGLGARFGRWGVVSVAEGH